MIENWEEFYAEIENLSLPELEAMIKTFYDELQRSRAYMDDRLEACLCQRKYRINKNFKFTTEAVKHFERVNRILTESTAKVLQRTKFLHWQMVELKTQGNDFLDDFVVEGTVAIVFLGEDSVLMLDEDENNGQSDYIAMADVLEYTQLAFEYLRSFTLFDRDNVGSNATDEERETDHLLELNWNIELLNAPESVMSNTFAMPHIFFSSIQTTQFQMLSESKTFVTR